MILKVDKDIDELKDFEEIVRYKFINYLCKYI